MVGNVWQMTNDMYFNGSNYLTVIRGGSYYKPNQAGGIFREVLSHSTRLRYYLWFHQGLTEAPQWFQMC